MYLTDELLDKVAKERNVTPLAHAFNVKLSDASDMYEEVKWSACLEKLAQNGIVARNDDELAQIMQVVEMVQAKHANDNQVQADSGIDLIKAAGEQLSRGLGIHSPEATAAYYSNVQDSQDKVSQFLGDPAVIMHMLALKDAADLVR